MVTKTSEGFIIIECNPFNLSIPLQINFVKNKSIEAEVFYNQTMSSLGAISESLYSIVLF